jgi:hypothetical protein
VLTKAKYSISTLSMVEKLHVIVRINFSNFITFEETKPSQGQKWGLQSILSTKPLTFTPQYKKNSKSIKI